MSATAFTNSLRNFEHLQPNETDSSSKVTLYGRVKRRRKAGTKLSFYDLESGGRTAQAIVDDSKIQHSTASSRNDELAPTSSNTVQDSSKKMASSAEEEQEALHGDPARSLARRGDWLSITGHPHRSSAGQLSLLAIRPPQILAPSLQPVSLAIENPEFLNHNRHASRIIDPIANHALILRHNLIHTLRTFFIQRHFIEVSTPLLTAHAGGASARPFETEATEFSDLTLNLRIAPELFLKRLVLGNLERIFEIGPAFRNEGVDATHNPEFSICEFYQAMTDLPQLIAMTEAIFRCLSVVAHDFHADNPSDSSPALPDFTSPLPQLPFIPTLESTIRHSIPDWTFPNIHTSTAQHSTSHLLNTYAALNLPIPAATSLPSLLDTLAGHILEPLCSTPTWLTYQPECMSPLAKSFTHTSAGVAGASHIVSARAELFIQGREYVNCYEEENSPVAQRAKFEAQQALRRHAGGDEGAEEVDENYLAALEWGLPPTGGWGMGIDRMVMLMAGKARIADVLPFGTLNNVVALGQAKRTSRDETSESRGKSAKEMKM